MRPDMGKCIIERPRGNSSAPSAKARDYGRLVYDESGELDYEGFTHLPASRKQEGYHKKLGSKDFSDVLGPLDGYLRTNCGRPWNDVYSEIARTIGRSGSYGIRHILSQHLDVAVKTYRGRDGHVYECGRHGVHRVGGFYSDFYVEPETGLLRAAVNYRKWRSDPTQPKPRKPIEQIQIGEGREYRKIKGIWYFLEFVLTEERIPRYYRGALVGVITEQLRTVTVKRQLGKKALKALGLRK